MAKGKQLETVVSLAGNVDPSLQKAVDSATKTLGGIDKKAMAIGVAAGAIAIGIGKAVFEGGQYLLELGGRFDEAYDAIRIGTGATGGALEDLQGDFEEVYKSVPTNMEDASTAIADYNTRLGLTGEGLQQLSIQAIQTADMLDEDLTTTIEKSSQAFQQFGIEEDGMSAAMDHAFKVSQATGTGFNDLLDKAKRFGPQLQEMGYGFEESTALIGQMEKQGIDLDSALAAMKKSVGDMAKEGLSAAEGLEQYTDKIKNAESETEAINIASEIFGARGASSMASAIRSGALDIADFTAELEASTETIGGAADDTYDFAERLQMFKQQAEVALAPLANTVFDSLNELMPVVSSVLEGVMPVIEDVANTIAPLVVDLVDQLKPAFEQILPPITEIAMTLISTLLPPLMKLMSAVMPSLIKVISALTPILDLVFTLLSPLLDIVVAIITPIIELATGALAPLIEMFGNLISMALTPIMPILEAISALLRGDFSGAFASIMPIIQTLQGAFQGVMDFLTGVFEGGWSGVWGRVSSIFSGWANGIVNIIKSPVNAIIGGVNSLIGSLNSLKVPDWVPLVGGKSLNIPNIPQLASGGFTKGVSIAGEAGMEAVLSFDPAYRNENLSYWARAGQLLGVAREDLLSRFAFGGGNNSNVEVGGVTFAPVITVTGEADAKGIVERLHEELEEFLDLLEEIFGTRGGGQEYAADW